MPSPYLPESAMKGSWGCSSSDDDTDKKQKQAPCSRSSGKDACCFNPVPAPLVSKVSKENGGYPKGAGGHGYGALLTKSHRLRAWEPRPPVWSCRRPPM